MKQILTLILLFIFAESFPQTPIFKDYDFNSGAYSIYFVDVGDPELIWKRDSLGRLLEIDTSRHFYTNDISVLNQLKDEWLADSVGYMYECWYDYFIYLAKNDSTVLKMRLNLDCEELLVEGFPFKIDTALVTKFFPKFKRIKKRVFRCDDFQDGREFWKDVIKDKQFVLKDITKPKWIDYDGEFRFDFKDSLNFGVDSVFKHINKELYAEFPDEKFSLEWYRNWSSKNQNVYHFRLKCNKSLYNTFNLYEKQDWKEYSNLRIKLFWIPNPNSIE